MHGPAQKQRVRAHAGRRNVTPGARATLDDICCDPLLSVVRSGMGSEEIG